MHSLLLALATTPAPTPTPSLRPGLSQDQVTPGLLGFLLTAFIVVLTALLIVDMVRRIRRVRYRAQVEEERAAAGRTPALPPARAIPGPPGPGRGPPAPRTPPASPAPARKPTVMQDPDAADRGTRPSLPRGRQRPGRRTLCLPPAARRQPRALAAVRRRGLCLRRRPRRAGLPLDRLCRLPLVPRHGPRILRGPGHRGLPERQLRGREGGPGGAPRRRRRLHGRDPGDQRRRRLADVRVPAARRPGLLCRHLLSAPAAARPALLPPGAGGRGRRLAGAPRRRGTERRHPGPRPRRRRSPAPPCGWAVCRSRSIRPCPRRPCRRWPPTKTRTTAASAPRRSSRRRRSWNS